MPDIYIRPFSAVKYMEVKAPDPILCMTTFRTIQSSFPDGEHLKSLSVFHRFQAVEISAHLYRLTVAAKPDDSI